MDVNCVFCDYMNAVKKEHMICENEKYAAFLSKRPMSIGHTIIIPKMHLTSIVQLDADIFPLAEKVSDAIIETVKTDLVNIQVAYGPVMKTLPHAHAHLIPVYRSDMGDISERQKDSLAGRIREAMNKI